MDKSITLSYFSKTIIKWYLNHKRDLPWREINDPYLIWISEIILQQTRVNQGISYYIRFIERFPTIKSLAEADENEVLNYWQGLGYYSRARNLHKAACQIVTENNCIFPIEHKDVIKLSGVGEYTAAAICSLAYNQPYAVVDGNVYRVLSRLFGIETPIDSTAGKKEFALLAQNLLSKSKSGLHNQAVMEFGALQCLPTSPKCEICPLQDVCKAKLSGLIDILPVKSKKTKVTNRFFNYFFVEFKGNTFLQKRTTKDIWQNLYEFPLIETDRLLNLDEIISMVEFKNIFSGIEKVEIKNITNPMKHVLSHRVIYAQFVIVSISAINDNLLKIEQLPITKIDDYPVSRLMELFLQNLKE